MSRFIIYLLIFNIRISQLNFLLPRPKALSKDVPEGEEEVGGEVGGEVEEEEKHANNCLLTWKNVQYNNLFIDDDNKCISVFPGLNVKIRK